MNKQQKLASSRSNKKYTHSQNKLESSGKIYSIQAIANNSLKHQLFKRNKQIKQKLLIKLFKEKCYILQYSQAISNLLNTKLFDNMNNNDKENIVQLKE